MLELFDKIMDLQTGWIILGNVCFAALIAFSGSYLANLADRLSDITRISSTWIGIILLATITSIPELVATIAAVYGNAPDIGIGNLYGSNMFNINIISLIDILQGPGPIMLMASMSHILPASLGILLVSMSGAGIITVSMLQQSGHYGTASTMNWIFCIAIFLTYIIGTIVIFHSEKSTFVGEITHYAYRKKQEPMKIVIGLLLSAAGVIAGGIFLAGFSRALAAKPINLGFATIVLGQSFVGTTLVAVATSLPEIVVSIAAFRIGAINMSLANVFGSNTFNISIIAVLQLIRPNTNILGSVQQIHVLTACFAIMLTAIALMGLIYRSRKSILYLGWDTLAVTGLYLLALYLVFYATAKVS